MTVLSAQSIRRLCVADDGSGLPSPTPGLHAARVAGYCGPMIYPFVDHAETRAGRSYGLSACTYDCRISDGLVVPVGQSRLAATMERFRLPTNVCGSVLDKSTWARVFLTAFNTHLDPGWEGWLTVELSNLGTEVVILEPGDPLVQVKFEWLDEPTVLPYVGKYQSQEAGLQPARYR